MAALLDALRSRSRQRDLNATDLIAEAARAAAAGKTYDVGALEGALDRSGMSVSEFERAVETARRRAVWLSQFDGLAAATARAKKLEAAVAAEEEKFDEQRQAFQKRVGKIRQELDVVLKNRDAGQAAKQELLNPSAVPGSIGDQYREAVAVRDAAYEVQDGLRRKLREAQSRLRAYEGNVTQTVDSGKKVLADDHTRAERSRVIDDYERRIKSTQRVIGEIEAELAAADQQVAAAEAEVAKLEPQVLQA